MKLECGRLVINIIWNGYQDTLFICLESCLVVIATYLGEKIEVGELDYLLWKDKSNLVKYVDRFKVSRAPSHLQSFDSNHLSFTNH